MLGYVAARETGELSGSSRTVTHHAASISALQTSVIAILNSEISVTDRYSHLNMTDLGQKVFT